MQNLFLILTMIFFQQQLSAQASPTDEYKYKVEYELTYQPDSTDAESQKDEEMFLYIGDGISRFSSAGKAIEDSILNSMDRQDFSQVDFRQMRSQIPKTSFKYYIYKGIPAGRMTYTRKIFNDNYSYAEDKELFDWTIFSETDTIAGFQVQKATTSFAGRDYTAWFTQEIPFPEGPYKFNGLPGLIVKIADDRGHYVFEMKEIQKLKEPLPLTYEEEEFIETTPEELSEVVEEYEKDPLGFVKRSVPGLKIEFGSKAERNKMERERKERLKKQNNPLELE